MKYSHLRSLIFILFFKPLTWFIFGVNVKHKERLPLKGPAILIANHNSHLDTIIIMSLYPLSTLAQLRPVAAAEYFMKNRFLKWFTTNILQIIPIPRTLSKVTLKESFADVQSALANNQILIFYPEGTRGEPDKLMQFKRGISKLAQLNPQVPIVPIYLHGAGKILPKNKKILVPLNINVVIGEHVLPQEVDKELATYLHEKVSDLKTELTCLNSQTQLN